MKARCWWGTIGILILAVTAPAAIDEGERLQGIKGDAGKALSTAGRVKPDLLACACLAEYLRAAEDLTDPDDIEDLVKFCNGGRHIQAAFLITMLRAPEEWDRLVQTLITRIEPDAARLAAAVLAYATVQEEMKPPVKPVSASAAKRGKGKRAREKAAAAPPVPVPPIPEKLLLHRDPETARLALLAAAFSGNESVRSVVARLKTTTPDALAARMLYMAQIKEDLSERTVRYVLDAAAVPVVVKMTPAMLRRGKASALETYLADIRLPPLALVARALGVLNDPTYAPDLTALLKHSAVEVRVEALRALQGMLTPTELRPLLLEVLPTAPWDLVVHACAWLARYPDPTMIEPVLNRLETERGRIRLDLTYVLSVAAAEQKGETPAEWTAWWAEQAATFQVNSKASEAYRAKHRPIDMRIPSLSFFYGLKIYSDRVVYVVDSSKSMKGSRVASLRQNLAESLQGFRKTAEVRGESTEDLVQYNIVDFGGNVNVLVPGALTDNTSPGVTYARKFDLTLGTRAYDALETAAALPGVDSLYFLSDGAPVRGQFQSWQRTRKAMRWLTRYVPLAVHTAAFTPSEKNALQMGGMAKTHEGAYEAVQE